MVVSTSKIAGDDDGTGEVRDATGGLGSWLDTLRGEGGTGTCQAFETAPIGSQMQQNTLAHVETKATQLT